jgi:hypothetical protein
VADGGLHLDEEVGIEVVVAGQVQKLSHIWRRDFGG